MDGTAPLSLATHTDGMITKNMIFKVAAIALALLGFALGVAVILATGANSLVKQILGLTIPTLAGLVMATAWWRRSFWRW